MKKEAYPKSTFGSHRHIQMSMCAHSAHAEEMIDQDAIIVTFKTSCVFLYLKPFISQFYRQ